MDQYINNQSENSTNLLFEQNCILLQVFHPTCDIRYNSTIALVSGSANVLRLGTSLNMALLNVP